jgi:hemolysin activation/secretion protein
MKTSSMLVTLLLASVASSALAQPPVGAVGQLQQIPAAPPPLKAIPDIRVQRSHPASEPEAGGARVVVKSLRVTGATLFSEAELIAATNFRSGQDLDLAGLRAMAERISDFYGRHGYFVAQAYLPAQDINDGTVMIAVIEGRYGKVAHNNQAPVSERVVRGALAGLNSGDPVATAPLQRRLLLLSDLSGVAVKSTLTPGDTVGTSDILFDLMAGPRLTGSVEADNAGNRYTGVYRGGGTITFNEPTGQGDMATLRLLTAGEGLTYIRGAYQARVGAATVGLAYVRLAYSLGREYASLDATGTLDAPSLYGSYPLIRSRDTNLNLTGELALKRSEDMVGATSSETRKSDRVATLGLAGDRQDRVLGGGWTSFSVAAVLGDLDIPTPDVAATDALTARTAGAYQKVSFEVSRLQTMGGPVSLYGQVRGQLASKNLDSSEKMELGGADGVRAYPEGEAYGDEGYVASVEARVRLSAPSERLGGQLQALTFIDHGTVSASRFPWGDGPNRRTLSAIGAGLSWAGRHGVTAKASYAIKVGEGRTLSGPDRAGRLWISLSKSF